MGNLWEIGSGFKVKRLFVGIIFEIKGKKVKGNLLHSNGLGRLLKMFSHDLPEYCPWGHTWVPMPYPSRFTSICFIPSFDFLASPYFPAEKIPDYMAWLME